MTRPTYDENGRVIEYPCYTLKECQALEALLWAQKMADECRGR